MHGFEKNGIIDWGALITSQPSLARVAASLRELAEVREIAAGRVLARVGDPVNWIWSVISGELRLVRRSRTGAEVILQRARGGFIAEASLSSKTYHCDLMAAEGGVVLRFPVKPFRAMLDQNADFRDAWIAELAQEVRKLRSQSERLSLHGAAERIIHYLESEGSDGAIELSQSRKAWAAELGLSHESLYRTLSRLQSEGQLDIDGPRIAFRKSRKGNARNQGKKSG